MITGASADTEQKLNLLTVYFYAILHVLISVKTFGTYDLKVTINPSNGCKSTDYLKGILTGELVYI
jgi:hypothetical protein